MDSFECYSRFDHPRSLQTLVQKLAFYFVVVLRSTLAQYSEGVKKKEFNYLTGCHARYFQFSKKEIFNFLLVDYYIFNYKKLKNIFFFEKLKIMIFQFYHNSPRLD